MSTSNSQIIDGIRRKSCLDMSLETGLDFDECYNLQSTLFGDIKEDVLYNIQIYKNKVSGVSKKTTNILKNINNDHSLELAEGLVIAMGFARTEFKDLVFKSILAIIFFVRAYRNLSKIKLSRDHVFFLLSLNNFNGEVDIRCSDEFLQRINENVQQFGNTNESFNKEKCDRVYNELLELDIVYLNDQRLFLRESIIVN